MDKVNAAYDVLAPYYEMLSDSRDWDGWISYVNAVLTDVNLRRPVDVLDAACGTGRIAAGLASAGYEIVGVDASAAMLQQARLAAAKLEKPWPLFHQDLRQLRLSQRFDAAVCLCDGLNYLTNTDDLERVLHNIATHLRSGGTFLFDINTEWKLENIYGDFVYGAHYGDVSYVWENSYDNDRRTVTMEMAFFVRQQDGTYRRHDEIHVQRAHSHLEILSALDAADLKLLDYGLINGHAPPEPVEERVFYLAQRSL